MKKLVTAAALLAAIAPASAADLPVAAKAPPAPAYSPVSWQGWIIDFYGAYAGDITHDTSALGTASFDLASIPHGPGVGGALGYLFDTGSPFVFGGRLDASWLSMTDSGQLGSGALSFSKATHYLFNADVIAGFALGQDRRLLAYLDGGFAGGGATASLQMATLQSAVSATSTGWNIGAGLRYKVPTTNWQVFAEGDYYQLGDKSLSLVDAAGATVATSTNKFHIVTQRLGASYQIPPY